MLIKLRKMFGMPMRYTDLNYYLYPRPKDLISRRNDLSKAGVGYRANALINAAKRFLAKNAISNLEEIKYVGSYTAGIARILALRDYSVFPLDRWFTKLLTHVYFNDKKVSKKELTKFIRGKWGRWCGLAAIMITAVTGAKTINEVIKDFDKNSLNPFPNHPAPLTLWMYKE